MLTLSNRASGGLMGQVARVPLILGLVLVLLAPQTTATHAEAATASYETHDCTTSPGFGIDPGLRVAACHVSITVTLTVTNGCADNVCRFSLDANLTAWTDLPGLHASEITVMAGNGGSICVGPQPVSEALQPALPCARIAQERAIGTVSETIGNVTRDLPLQAGDVTVVFVLGHFSWNGLQWTAVDRYFWIVHDGAGEVAVTPVPMAGD